MSLLTIGEFAALSRLSAKALRRYDELGLLRPARVDAHNGYRWYVPEHGVLATEVLGRWCAARGEKPSGARRQIFFADLRSARPDDPACDVAAPLPA